MSHEASIHAAQTSILRELLFRPEAGYAELQKPTGLSSDHFNFHIKRLVELGFVRKREPGTYSLTPRGKEYANKLDTDNNTIERQPKVTVLLAITKEENGRRQYLFQERLKHPYYGYWGFPSGKMRWGETIIETAARELMEETGLEADCRFLGIYHEHTRQAETDELLEDKIFLAVHCENPRGELIERFEGGRNAWLLESEVMDLKVFSSFATEMETLKGGLTLAEETHRYSADNF